MENKNQYPKWKYHATEKPVMVDSEEAEKALGKGWKDTPAGFSKEEKKEADGK